MILPSVREFLDAVTGRVLGRRTREMELRIPGMASGQPMVRTQTFHDVLFNLVDQLTALAGE